MAHWVKVKGPTLTLSERPLQDFFKIWCKLSSNLSRDRPICPETVQFGARQSNYERTVPLLYGPSTLLDGPSTFTTLDRPHNDSETNLHNKNRNILYKHIPHSQFYQRQGCL